MVYGLLILMAIFPIAVIGFIVYIVDKEKESVKSLLIFYFLGLLAAFVSSIIETLFYLEETNLFYIFIDCFIFIALVEELAKFLCTKFGTMITDSYNNFFDSIVFCTAVSLGFAGIENILYILRSHSVSLEVGLSVGLLRAFLSVPGHAAFAIFMGYFLDKKNEYKLQGRVSVVFGILAVVVPVFLHGLYDFFCLSFTEINSFVYFIIFCLFIVFLYVSSIILIVKGAKKSHIRFDGANNTSYIFKCFNCGNVLKYTVCEKCGMNNTNYIDAINRYAQLNGEYPNTGKEDFKICPKCGNFSGGYFCNKCGNVLR